MSEQHPDENARPRLKLVKSAGKHIALNMIPGYPLYGAVKGFRQATAPGAAVIADLAKRRPQKHAGQRRARTWNQAMEARPADALPLREIERLNTRAKQLFMVACFFGLCINLGNVINYKWIGVFSCGLFMLVCLMQMFKHELRLRQMETGPKNPDCLLMSAGEFLRSKGFVKHLLNPRLEWK